MIDILFTTPPLSRQERYGELAGAGSSAPTLGILMLAAVAREQGYPCRVIDAAALNLSLDELLEQIAAAPPKLLGISATTLAIGRGAEFAAAVRQRWPEIRIIIGGPHVSAIPVETMNRFPVFDVAVVGEGEATLAELLPLLASGGELAGVAGILFRDQGRLVQNSQRAYLADLDRLPRPAWDLLEGFPRKYSPPAFKTRQLPAASLVTSRGCPNRCIFCDRSVFGASCHAYSAEAVVSMVESLYRDFGVREFSFEDDTFVTFKVRLQDICRRLIELALPISWSCLGRVNRIERESLDLMWQAGCWQISFGIESGNQEILNTIRKNVTIDQIRSAVIMTHSAGILSKGFFIVGHPGETKATLRQTRDFALELPLDDISVTMLTPFPGTELFDRAAEFGTFDNDWTRMNLLTPVFVPFGLTRDELEMAQKDMLRSFYLRPRIIANYGERALRNPAMLGALWQGLRSFMKST